MAGLVVNDHGLDVAVIGAPDRQAGQRAREHDGASTPA
jgi:hypothetical protein